MSYPENCDHPQHRARPVPGNSPTSGHQPTPPPNTPRRARSVSVTGGVLSAVAGRASRLQEAARMVDDGNESPPPVDAEELEYVDIPPGFEWPIARPSVRPPAAGGLAGDPLGGAAHAPPSLPATPPPGDRRDADNTEPDRQARKRVHIESPSPTPPSTTAAGRLPRTSLSVHARSLGSGTGIAPAEWRRPSARIDRPNWAGANRVATPWRGASRLSAPGDTLADRVGTPLSPSASGRGDAENVQPEEGVFEMDLDLPLLMPLANGRTPSSASLPLSVLDVNRNRFPTAISPNGPVYPEAFEAAWPGAAMGSASTESATLVPSRGSAWAGIPWPTNNRPGDAAAATVARPLTPFPLIGATESVPPTPYGSLAASFPFPTPPPGIPIPGATGAGRVLSRTATYTAAGRAPPAPALPTGPIFTPTPVGGFPEVVTNEPDDLLAGLPMARIAAVRDPATGNTLGVHVFNAGFPSARDLRPMSAAITETIQGFTGELTFLLVPPEVEWAVPPERRPDPPITWIVLGLSSAAVERLAEQRVISTPAITLLLYRPVTSVPRFLFLAGGFAHDHNNSVMHAIWTVFSGPRVLPGILNLAQSNSAFIGMHPEDVARQILGSLEVRVTTLRNGNIIAAIFCDSPTSSPPRWREWRDSISRLPFPSSFNSTGFARRAGRCRGCHGSDHPTYLCPFQDVPGWNTPTPGAHWAQTGPPPPDGPVNVGAPPPGPPPPPSRPCGGLPPRGHGSGRGGLGKRDRRDRSGGGAGFALGGGSAPLF
ncbi:hypothetical protein C2E23DRAFT_879929 [Lenzites betulinus]|nr:hypothetical protein C2E23DRAFT_879929 [Lenzites betulinus]